MEDYQKLYKQSLIQIKKQKEQIRKLQDEIRERCQSYLIYSSRYRSKRGENDNTNQKVQSSQIVSESSSKSQGDINQNAIQSNVIDVVLDFNTPKKDLIDQQTETIEVVEKDQENYKTSASKGRMPIQQQVQSQKTNNIPEVQKPVIQNIPKQQQQAVLSDQNSNFWQGVVEGLNERISAFQKQKTEQAQRIRELEQEIKNYKQQQSQWTESAMKKKQAKSVQYTSAQKQEILQMSISEEYVSKLLTKLSNIVDFSNCSTLQEKMNKLEQYIVQLNERVKQREDIVIEQNSLKQSLVSDYNLNTPYRKIKQSNSRDAQMRDAYEESEVEMLRKKCQQLRMELTVSRNQKEKSPLLQQSIEIGKDNVEEQEPQIINEPPILIQQELEKPNNPFVKRSFIRKKVVKRNLSAMILRTPSKSKEESKTAMINQLQKLKSHLEKSKDGSNQKEILSLSKKINKLESNIEGKQQKIDEVSDDGSSLARASGVSQDNFTQIIQVETQGPGFRNYTAHILGLNKKDNSQRKKKENFYV